MSRMPSGQKKENMKNVMHAVWSGHGWSRTPYGLAMIATRQKKGKPKNVTHAVWSACGRHQQKKGKREKCHACRLVWP